MKSLIKEKEEPFELDQTINVMEEELNEITSKESDFFLEIVVARSRIKK